MGHVSEKGWGWPLQAEKAHYFIRGLALCARWEFHSRTLVDEDHNSADNCTICRNLLKALKEKQNGKS